MDVTQGFRAANMAFSQPLSRRVSYAAGYDLDYAMTCAMRGMKPSLSTRKTSSVATSRLRPIITLASRRLRMARLTLSACQFQRAAI
jgi:hypothetical protein